jgi:hypothetical protein
MVAQFVRSCSRIARWGPATSSSLAEGERLRSLLCPLLAPLAEAGARKPLPSSLRSQTKSVSARSLVQDSGAPAWLSTAGARFPNARS